MCAWDLEEPESRHPEEQLTGGSVFTRRPSYTTEYLADVATTAAPIVGIATTPKSEPAGQRRQGRASDHLPINPVALNTSRSPHHVPQQAYRLDVCHLEGVPSERVHRTPLHCMRPQLRTAPGRASWCRSTAGAA